MGALTHMEQLDPENLVICIDTSCQGYWKLDQQSDGNQEQGDVSHQLVQIS